MDISQFKALPNQHDHDGAHVLKPKLRKPYTTTKQREKWTDDEHNKFLDALKLYGRAWRQIEEFIGTKTAVQIRSHAQKFFSKVVRCGNDTAESPVEAIEIPPARPKRKPAHPYPRKLVDSRRNIELAAFQPEKRKCSNILTTNYANHSPNSVLPAAMPLLLISESPDSCLSSSSGSADLQSGSLFSVNNGKAAISVDNSFANSAVDISADMCVKYSEEVAPPEVTIILFGQIVSTITHHSLRNDSSLTRSLAGSQTDASCSAEELTHEKQQVSSLKKIDSPKGLPSALNFTHFSLLGEVETTSSKRAYKSGFVPYQRCFAAGNIKSANALAEEEGSQLVQLCL